MNISSYPYFHPLPHLLLEQPSVSSSLTSSEIHWSEVCEALMLRSLRRSEREHVILLLLNTLRLVTDSVWYFDFRGPSCFGRSFSCCSRLLSLVVVRLSQKPKGDLKTLTIGPSPSSHNYTRRKRSLSSLKFDIKFISH